jgi:hypothetical protein
MNKWMSYGGNQCRYRIVIAFTFINKQIMYIFFSGFFNIPLTSLPFTNSPSRSFYIIHIVYITFEIVLIFVGLLICAIKSTLQYNYKLFFSAADLTAIFTISLIFDILFLVLVKKQTPPTPYHKYVLPNVSNHTLPAIS